MKYFKIPPNLKEALSSVLNKQNRGIKNSPSKQCRNCLKISLTLTLNPGISHMVVKLEAMMETRGVEVVVVGLSVRS